MEHVLRFGWACYQRTRTRGEWTEPEWLRFDTLDAFWEWALSKVRPRTRLYLFAHNWAFDAPVLDAFDHLGSLGWKLSRAVVESPPIILTWRKDRASLVLLDTLNWWRMPLRTLGDSIGVPKLAFPDPDASSEEWDTYARNDVEVIRRAVHEWWSFLDSHDMGGFANTLAGQSLRAFRHRFQSHLILIDDDEEALALARESYHGGRVEAFRLGIIPGPVHVLDVTSMYPHVMREHQYPTVLRLHARQVELDELSAWLGEYHVVARCTLRTREPRYALTLNGKLVFPIGTFATVLTTPDLAHALRSGEIVSCSEAAAYDRAPIFRSFVDDLFAVRQSHLTAGDTVRAWLVKILMNSLYGKFGQHGQVWETVERTTDRRIRTWIEWDADAGTRHAYRQYAGIVQERMRDVESADSHPAIAAHVTAYAREHLWRLILRAGRSEAFYCDTDSLFVSERGHHALKSQIDGAKLGLLKHEGAHERAIIRGLKDYELGHVRKTKGARRGGRWVDDQTIEQLQWSSLPGLIREGQLHAPVVRPVTKHFSGLYTKGTPQPDGSVLPFCLGQD